MSDSSSQPSESEDAGRIQSGMSRGARLLEVAEGGLYLVVGYVLMFAAAGLLISALVGMIPSLQERDLAGAVIHLLDRLLLALMLAELTFTVRRIGQTHQLEVTSFLVIAIIASVRRMLVITVEYAAVMDLQSPVFRAFLGEMIILSLLTLFLSASIYLIRRAGGVDMDH